MTNAQFYFLLLAEIAGVLILLLMLLRTYDKLENRIDRVQDRVHNDYEALIVKVVQLEGKVEELDAHVSRLESKIGQLTT
jgi:hypothetical protein